MKIKSFSFKAIISTILLAILSGFFAVSHSATTEEQAQHQKFKVLRYELIGKAKLCKKYKNQECVSVCSDAIQTWIINKDMDVAQPLIDQCNELAGPFEKEFAAKIAAELDITVLKEGLAWMPDVEAIVSKPRGGQSALLVARDRKDFHASCHNELNRYVKKPEQRKAVQIGMRVRLKYVQYNPKRKGDCRVGEVEILE